MIEKDLAVIREQNKILERAQLKNDYKCYGCDGDVCPTCRGLSWVTCKECCGFFSNECPECDDGFVLCPNSGCRFGVFTCGVCGGSGMVTFGQMEKQYSLEEIIAIYKRESKESTESRPEHELQMRSL